MKKRLVRVVIILILFCLIDSLVCYMPILELYRKGFINEGIFNENLIFNDYHSLIKYSVVYMFVFIFFIDYTIGRERIDVMIRYTDRMGYCNNIVKKAFFVSFIYILVHELVSILFAVIVGNASMLVGYGWLEGELMQILLCTIFYIIVFFVYKIVNAKMVESVARIFTVLIFVGIYYIGTILGGARWFILSDLTLLKNFCGGCYSYQNCVVVIVRWICIYVLLYFVFIETSKRRDYLRNEKK